MVVHAIEPKPRVTAPSHRGGLSGKYVEDHFLHPAMDGRALNLAQYDPSPEVDSDLEWAIVHIETGRLDLAVRSIRSAIQANQLEGEKLRAIAGSADECACAARNTLTVTPGLSGRGLVRKLTSPLGRLVKNPADEEAAAEVRAVVDSVPRSMFTTPTLRHQLGKRKSAALFSVLGEVDR